MVFAIYSILAACAPTPYTMPKTIL